MSKKSLTTIVSIVGGIFIIALVTLLSNQPPQGSGFVFMALWILSIASIIFGVLNLIRLPLWPKLLLSIIAGLILFWLLVAAAFWYGDTTGYPRLPPAEAEKFENWKTYKGSGFEMKYPDENGVLLIAQSDGRREFLFGGASCGNSEKESSVLGSIKFFPAIEGGTADLEYVYDRNYTKEDCDQFVTRWILHGRFCTDKNLTKYQAWCSDDSKTSFDYHRYDIYLACSWPGKEGRIKCNQIFDQSLSTFRFTE